MGNDPLLRDEQGHFEVLSAIIISTLMLMAAVWIVQNRTGNSIGSGTNDVLSLLDLSTWQRDWSISPPSMS